MSPYRDRSAPGHIRVFADTTDSPLGLAAFEYTKSLMRIAPVRVVTMTGTLVGRWMGYMSLLTTPMMGSCVNTVCCAPERWTWLAQVPMPDRNVGPVQAAMGGVEATEVAAAWQELHTEGMRNVLFTIANPADLEPPQIRTALKYDALVVPDGLHMSLWIAAGAHPRIIANPVTDHAAIRDAVLG